MPSRPAGTRRADRPAPAVYLSKAVEVLYAAKQSLEVGNFAAATGNAIHASMLPQTPSLPVAPGWCGEVSMRRPLCTSRRSVATMAAKRPVNSGEFSP